MAFNDFSKVLFMLRYGRKFALILGCLGSGLFGVLRIFAVNYTQFAIFEFMDAFFGAACYSTSYIIGMELVTPRLRTMFGTLLNCFYAFGEIFLGLVAMWFRNYKIILLITYPPAFLVLFYVCILPQSKFNLKLIFLILLKKLILFTGIRWLLMKGYNGEAKKILMQASKFNKTSLSENSLFKLDERVELRVSTESINQSASIKHKTSWRVILQIANISYLWFATIFVYYGLNINAVYLEYWDKYISFIVSF